MPKALIVDDVEENLYLLQSLLRGNDYEVSTAADGQAALEQAEREAPDIVISDILMPGMDGFTLCRRWRQDPRFADIPFVFYTATYTDPRDEEFALRLGADLFLVKPLDPAEFLERIAGVLARVASGQPRPGADGSHDEPGYLREYSETLIRKLEDKLAQLLEANRSLLIKDSAIQSAASGIALLGLDGRVTYANPAMGRLFGKLESALIGQSLEELAGSEAAAIIERGLRASGDWSGEVDATAAPGEPIVLDGVAHTVSDPGGRPLCRMVSFQDVTERRRMAEEMQRNQRMASLCLFAGGIAHDFNNLLTGLFGNIELAIAALPARSPARGYLETSTLAFERARDLTSRLLSFAKSKPPCRRRQVILPLLRECCSLSLSGAVVRWTIDGSETESVQGDPNQLSQVFTNILINARQAMPGGGTVRISVKRVTLAGDSGDLSDGPYVQVSFADDGPGIPATVIHHVFDPFFTTKPGGTGLGLAVCHSIIESHSGAIRVTSRPGEGTDVTVLLPADEAEREVTESVEPGPDRQQEEAPDGARVLVMDDEPQIREMAARMLVQAGHEVRTVADGHQALDACRHAQLAGRPFDVVVLDVTVRGGMGGLETLAEVRKRQPETAIVLSSGYAERGWTHGEIHPDAVLPKPYQMRELLDCVSRARAVARERGR